MDPPAGARGFQTSGDEYDRFMGRYSRPLARTFVDFVGITEGQTVLDVGCGPGALTGELVDRLGAAAVSACDPSEPFVADCALRHPGVDVRLGRAEDIPFGDDTFDVALAQLVLHFVSDPAHAAREFRRVLRPGGLAGACVWDFNEGMQMLRAFWDAALTIDPNAEDEARTMRFGGAGEIAELLAEAGFTDVVETTLSVSSTYADFDELWAGVLLGIGPAGSYCVSLTDADRARLRAALVERLGAPSGTFSLSASARAASGRLPA
ncbi:MAG: methyltransferase domain-containing protein [Ilumatobacteraceae bacterium]